MEGHPVTRVAYGKYGETFTFQALPDVRPDAWDAESRQSVRMTAYTYQALISAGRRALFISEIGVGVYGGRR